MATVDMATVNNETRLATEQALLDQAMRRLEEVTAQLAADGPMVTGSRGQPRPNPLLAIEQKLRDEVNRRRYRVNEARRGYGFG
jgi:hypothetical protein